MRKWMCRLVPFCCLVAVSSVVFPLESPDAVPGESAREVAEFESHRLGERLHRVAFSWGMRNNVVVLAGPEGILLVDSGFDSLAVEVLQRAVGDLSGGEIRYVINTHSHRDHVAGNDTVTPGARRIGFQDLGGEALGQVLSRAPDPLRGRTGLELPAPYVFRFDGEEIRIIPYPGLHSSHDVLVHFAESGVVFMGDLLLSQNCPAVQDARGYMKFLEKVMDVFPEGTTFVSGHGTDLTRAGLGKYRDDLAAMNALIEKGFRAGKSAEEMKRDNVLKDFKARYSFLEWLGPDWWIDQVCLGLGCGGAR